MVNECKNDFIEVSAVITHPNTLKGYARLVAHTANTILNQNKTAFLHVYEKTLELSSYTKNWV
jgi:predicted GNAT family acetyltransferase